MKSLHSIFFLLILVGFTSCEPEEVVPVSCFNASANPADAGQQIYFLNCSENYSGHEWVVDGVPLNDRHLNLAFPGPDTFLVSLKVWNYTYTDSSISVQEIFIN